jgi:tetratricopeptide (TPR) repeat protein
MQTQTSTDIADSEIKIQHPRPDSSQFDTDLNYEEADEHIVVADEPIAGNSNEDETLIFTDDDVAAFLGANSALFREQDDVAELSVGDGESETVYAESDGSDESAGEELSVSLFEEDDTLTVDEAASMVEPPSEEIELELAPQYDSTKSLNLVEVPDNDSMQVEVGKSETLTGITPSIGLEPHTLTGETSIRQESTATNTFAPDNYDRTLRKSAGDDVSKLFAGVKSDTDVVMTPEFAKKMFVSKSSAQRVHNVKIYSGAALGILMVIAVFGVLEIDRDTTNIDNSLRHLKRDPMPGLIKNTTNEKFIDIFAAEPGKEVDATTLQLVKNAELILDSEEVVAVELGVDDEIPVENAEVAQIDSENTTGIEVQPTPATSVRTSTGAINSSRDESATDNTIQISTKSSITEKDRLLREAYAAYKRGDDNLALIKYNAVLDIDPGNRNALLARAAIYIQDNRIAEAIRDYRTLLIENPKDSLAMSSMIAVANYSPAKSETQLKLMIRDEPDSPYLNFALGNIFGAQNRWQEAQGQYFVAFENNPNDPNYAYNLAVSLEHIAKPKVAIAYYERALSNFNKGLATFNRDVVDARLEMLRQL